MGPCGLILVASIAAIVNSFPMPAFFAGLPIETSMVIQVTALLALVAVVSALPPAWRALA